MATAAAAPHDVLDRFQRLAAQWKVESEQMSNTAQMAMLRSYQNIIGMGESAIPLILEEMRAAPDQWFWAMEAITLENPVPKEDSGKVERMTSAWVEWGIQKGYISR